MTITITKVKNGWLMEVDCEDEDTDAFVFCNRHDLIARLDFVMKEAEAKE